jgi:hypothetical protein
MPIDDDRKGDAVNARHDTAVELRSASIDGHRMTLQRVTNRRYALVKQVPEHAAHRVGRPANPKVSRALTPRYSEPIQIGLVATRGDDDSPWDNRMFPLPIDEVDRLDGGSVDP